ncbi:hypothetical protein [Nostoc sp.]|uniref:hypothetical protein n=1 Tax=Nostoc sp. TaxID=1180 RepID=UPI002FFA7769
MSFYIRVVFQTIQNGAMPAVATEPSRTLPYGTPGANGKQATRTQRLRREVRAAPTPSR